MDLRTPVPRRMLVALLLLNLALAWGFRWWLLHHYDVGTPWVAGITLGHAEMGRNVIAGRGWVVDRGVAERVGRLTQESSVLVDLERGLDGSETGEYVNIGYAHEPGYALWLAASFLVSGEYRFITSRIMQITLDSFGTLLVFGMAAMLAGPVAGVLAALLYALSPAHAFLPTVAVQAALDGFWMLAVSFGAVLAWRQARDGRRPLGGMAIVAAGTLCGAAMNSTAFVFPMTLFGMSLLCAPLSRPARRLAGWFLLAQLTVVLVLLPWAARNEAEFGQFTPIRGTSSQVVWSSWGDIPNPWGLGLDDKHYFNWIYENCPPSCTSSEREQLARDFLLDEVVPSPGFPRFLLDLASIRVTELREPFHIASGQLLPGAGVAWLRPMLLGLDHLVAGVLLVLPAVALVLIVLSRRDRVLPVLLGLSPTLFLLAFNLVTFVSVRKTTPAYAFLCVLAGIGAWWTLAWVSRHAPRLAGRFRRMVARP